MHAKITLSSQSVANAVSEVATLLLQHPLSYGQGMETAIDEAAYLVSFVAGLPPDFNDQQAQQMLMNSEREQIQNILYDRINLRIPLAYLLGETWQAGNKFYVNKQVLIPRSPIAEMINQRFTPWLSSDQNILHILDLCTGCGCLGILLAKQYPLAQVTISDIDSQALQVAQKNIELHDLENRVSTVISDVYAQLPAYQYDIITANPPYVPQSEQAELPSEFTHEPQHALFAGEDGLEIAKRIIFGASQMLGPQGLLVLEVGQSAGTLEACFPNHHFIWQMFENGGEGVCVLTRGECESLASNYRI